jgi:hypothetical protein
MVALHRICGRACRSAMPGGWLRASDPSSQDLLDTFAAKDSRNYFVVIGLVASGFGASVGEIARVNQAFQPSALCSAANSL